jgi:hypothetical protein
LKYTKIEILGKPDTQGRISHMRYWMTDYCPGHPEGEYVVREKGQMLFSVLPEEIKQMKLINGIYYVL